MHNLLSAGRMECYKCVTETLNYLWNAATALPQSPSMPKMPGPPPPTHDPSHMAVEQAEYYVSAVLYLTHCVDPIALVGKCFFCVCVCGCVCLCLCVCVCVCVCV